MKHTCPLCNGSGKWRLPKRNRKNSADKKRAIAKAMRDKGATIREVMKRLKYTSTAPVVFLLNER